MALNYEDCVSHGCVQKMSLSRFLFTGTFMCPRCSMPCFSNCCGIATTTPICVPEGPTLPDSGRKTKKRKYGYYKDKDEPEVTATADVSTDAVDVDPVETTIEFSTEVNATELSYEHGIGEGVVTDGAQGPSDIAAFLSRPILVLRVPWPVNSVTPAAFRFFPWVEFLTNGRVREKLATFKLLRATMKIRIFVNGSPFHFGRLFVGIKPGHATSTNNTVNRTPDTSVQLLNYEDGSGLITWQPNKTFYSQRPHVLINPNTNA